jgi:superfamily II DNA or RNA helicase
MADTILKMQNGFSWLQTDNQEIKKILWENLRFREKGYFHNVRYKQKKWDGYRDFFNKESGKFLTGLWPEIELVLKHFGINYNIEDERNKIKFKYDSVGEGFLEQWNPNPKKFNLHDYQHDLVNKVLLYQRGTIQAPTSAGKSAMMLAILKCIPDNCPTLILANRKSLVAQFYQDMLDWGFTNVGRLYDKFEEPNIFTCSTIQSLHKIEKLLPKFKALLVDEIHDMMSAAPKKAYGKLSNCSLRIAVSATPFKFGGTDKTQKFFVKGYFGPPLLTEHAGKGGILTTKLLQERGILSPSKCTFFTIDKPQLPYDIYMDAVTNGIAENHHFHKVVVGLTKQLKGRSLILIERLAHGDALHEMIPGSLWVKGADNMETRQFVIDQLKNSKENVVALATHQIFNTGINFFIHNLINAAGGKADHQIIQRLGRGLRTIEDKDTLYYYDFLFKINEYLNDHSNKRVSIIKKEGHEVEFKDIDPKWLV